MHAFQIVTLAPDEWQAYRALRLECLLREPQAFGSRYADMLQQPDAYWQGRLADARAGEKSWLLFAREDDRLVGMIGAFTTENAGVVKIVSVYVSRETRGKGVGSLLMAAILAVVEKKGTFYKAVLDVNPVQTAAVALYRRFGFAVTGEETVTREDGEIRQQYSMEKELLHLRI